MKVPGTDLSPEAIVWLLRDEFSSDLSAGSVNGTAPEPGPGGNRVVVDTNSKLSIASTQLSIATGGGGADEPRISYDQQTRSAGMSLFSAFTVTTEGIRVGLSKANTSQSVASMRFFDTSINIDTDDGSFITVGAYSTGSQYKTDIQLRTIGVYYLIKGGAFTNWTLLYHGVLSNDDPYPIISADDNASVYVGDFIRIPDVAVVLTPLAYDTFTRANGALGNSETSGPDSQSTPLWVWTGATFAIDTNEAKNTPTETGGELVTNGGMEGVYVDQSGVGIGTVNVAPNWDNHNCETDGTDTLDEELVIIHGGAKSQEIDVTQSNEGIKTTATPLPTIHTWYVVSAWFYRTAGIVSFFETNEQIKAREATTINTWVNLIATGRTTVANRRLFCTSGAASSFYVDDVSAKQLTLSTLFASLETSTEDVVIDVDIAVDPNFTQAGIVMNLDDATTPANFVIAYLGQDTGATRQAKLEKNVAGTYTTVIAAAVTFAADATLRVIKDGNDYRLYYNDAQVGATSVINDAGIVDNTLHGMFSTHVDNRLDNFTVFPRGTGGEYDADLDRYSFD